MTTTPVDAAALPADPGDRRLALTATGLLADFNRAGVLDAADVHVAQRLGRLGQESDERALLAVALTVRAVRAGSVCLPLDSVAAAHEDDPLPAGLAWPGPVAWWAAVEASPLTAAGVLRRAGSLLYLDRYYREESQVVDDLRARRDAGLRPVEGAALAQALGRYFPDAAHADQRAAAEAACLHPTSVVTGGPGTGKTTTIARLLGVLLELQPPGTPLRVALAAPTGKAAARMAQAVREATEQDGFPADHVATIRALEARTVHRLLGSRPDNRTRFRHDRTNRLPHDVVIVDETSMVSLTLMARLLEAVRPSARLVLVGDADQLVSVEAGAVLTDLVEGLESASPSPVRRLGPSRRFGAKIAALSEAIRAGDDDAVVETLAGSTGEVIWEQTDDPTEVLDPLLRQRAVGLHEAARSGDRSLTLARFGEHRLLCAHREGPFGVGAWNRRIETLLAGAQGWDYVPDRYPGQPLIVNANDYGLELFNGDTAVVCAGPDGGLVAAIDDGRSPEGRALPTSRLADVSTAHAMTVHRSQGSQFAQVTVLLPEAGSRILTRELLYTAVTRGRDLVRIVGTEEAVRAAVLHQARRATGLAPRLL